MMSSPQTARPLDSCHPPYVPSVRAQPAVRRVVARAPVVVTGAAHEVYYASGDATDGVQLAATVAKPWAAEQRTAALAPVMGRSAAKRDAVWARAAEMLDLRPPDWVLQGVFLDGASASERAVGAELREQAFARATDAGDPGRLETALGWLARYKRLQPNLVFLLPRGGSDDIWASAYNEAAFASFESYVRSRGSVRSGHVGERISADAAAGYSSALRTAAAVLGRASTTRDDTNELLPRVRKQMRLEEPAKSVRKLRRGLRTALVRRLAQLAGFDRLSHYGVTRWAVFRIGALGLLRAGEIGVTQRGRSFVPGVGLHWGKACVRWCTAAESGWRKPSVFLNVCPIKDATGRASRHPIGFPAVSEHGPSDEPMCPYSALWRLWLRDAAHLTEAERARTPIFRMHGGRPWATADVEAAVREAAGALGLPVEDFGGASLRIAGASDLRARFGMEGKALIQARGRWADEDIGFIYQRVTAFEMLDAVDGLGEDERGAAPELEAMLDGWAQPAVRR